MKYLLAIYENEKLFESLSQEEQAKVYEEYGALEKEQRPGLTIAAGEALHPTPTAQTIRVRDGKRTVTAGPFAETREHLGGFYLLEAASLDEALRFAEKIPAARTGCIEVRPCVDFSQPQP